MRQGCRITLVIRLGTVVGFDFDGKIIGVNIWIQQDAFTVWVNAADILSVDLNDHLSSCVERKVNILSFHMFRNVNMPADKSGSIRCEIHIIFFQRAVLIGIILILILRNLSCIADFKVRDLEFFFINAALQPYKTKVCPFLRSHTAADNFYMSHSKILSYLRSLCSCCNGIRT